MYIDGSERELLTGLGPPRLRDVSQRQISLEWRALLRLQLGGVGTVIEELPDISNRKIGEIRCVAHVIAVVV